MLELLSKAETQDEPLLAKISHEMRAPLSVIMGFTDFFLDPNLPVEERLQMATIVKRNGEVLMGLIKKLDTEPKPKIEEVNLKGALPPSREGNKPLKSLRLLLVEDSADLRLLMGKKLRALGAAVEEAEDGESALRKIVEHDIDIILMDIQMPGLSGHETTKRIRDLGFAKPVVALTAHGMDIEKERALKAGFNDYLTKPIDQDVMVQALLHLKNPKK